MENSSGYVFATAVAAFDEDLGSFGPCPPVGPSSLANVLKLRPGEVGSYVVYMCVWQSNSLSCAEPLQSTMSIIDPSDKSGIPSVFTGSDFTTVDLRESRFSGWLSETNNPFKLGVWRQDVAEYRLSTTGYACLEFNQERVEHLTVIQVELPSVSFNSSRSQCPPVDYSAQENTIGITAKNPIYPDKKGCSISYDIKQSSYNAQYGFLQVMSPSARILLQGKDKVGEDFKYTILDLRSPAVDTVKNDKGIHKVISQKVKLAAGQEEVVSHTSTYSTFSAPYFYKDCDFGDMSERITVDKYKNYGTQFYNYLMLKVDAGHGKESYWVPVKKAGWYSIYTAECSSPPCGVGLGSDEDTPYSNLWGLGNFQAPDPIVFGSVDIPSWGRTLEESYGTVSVTDFNEMDYWLSCPRSSYPLQELDSSAPTFHVEEL